MSGITWKQMVIPVVVFLIATVVQLLALIPLFCSIPNYEAIPYIDVITWLLNLTSWLLIVLMAVTLYGVFEELGVSGSIIEHLKMDSILVVTGFFLLILGSMSIPTLGMAGILCIVTAVGDVVYLSISNTGPTIGRRM